MDRLIAEIKVDKNELREICKEVAKNMACKHELEGMTNGQVVMQALRPVFPNIKVKEVSDYCGFGGFCLHIELIIDDWTVSFPIEWWEAQYVEGDKK